MDVGFLHREDNESNMEPTTFDQEYTAIRRAIIQQQFAHLNDKQQEAVYATEGPLLVLAGAGSGKTTVLINRISNLLRFGTGFTNCYAPPEATEEDLLFLREYRDHPTPEARHRAEWLCSVQRAKPWEILVITFTNKAAAELRERLHQELEEESIVKEIWAHTFHSACLRILHRCTDLLGFDTAFTIYDEDDKKTVMKNVIRRLNLDERLYDTRDMMNRIARAKDNLITPVAYLQQALDDKDPYQQKVAQVYAEYESDMKKAVALDFDDIIMKTVQILQQNPSILEHYQRQFRYVLIDEYQDTNHAQYVLASLLAGKHRNICVVGDDDQSIYKFRGATITNILEFEEQFQSAKTIRLEQNYRSTSNILEAANGIIQNNRQRKGKRLWTKQHAGSKIRVYRASDQRDEASYLIQQLTKAKQSGHSWSDLAILYRNNVISDNIVMALIRSQIPYRIYKGRDFFARAEIRDMLAYLSVLENPADTVHLRRIVNMPQRKIGDTSLGKAMQIAEEKGMTLYQVLQRASQMPGLSRAAKAMEQFIAMMEELRQQCDTLSLSELYELLLDQTGYRQMLELKGTEEALGRLEHILELKSQIVNYETEQEQPSLAGFLESMSLYTDADQVADKEEAVTLMTIHSAKGLEFPVVYLVGMDDGLFPSYRSVENQDDLEEERRLCYVAVTRAKEELILTFAEQRLLYGRTQYASPSRFIQEIPEALLYSPSRGGRSAAAPHTGGESDTGAWSESRANVASLSSSRHTASPKTRSAASTFSTFSAASAASTSSMAPLPDFPVGCRVQHKAFGTGMVVSVKPIGNDALLEIVFETVGTKRLMVRTAAKLMQRI